jgi:hypothetical protein
MASAERFGRRTQLLSGYGTCGEGHDCGCGKQYVFYHWTLLLSEKNCHLHQLSQYKDDLLRTRSPKKNPSKHLFAANKKIRIA